MGKGKEPPQSFMLSLNGDETQAISCLPAQDPFPDSRQAEDEEVTGARLGKILTTRLDKSLPAHFFALSSQTSCLH